jgi:Uma2 family endonuclease
MSEATASYVRFEDFLAGEQDSERRHEWVGGQVYAMSGGTERHDLMAGLIYEALLSEARAKGWRTFMGNRLLRTRDDSAYYPDVMIVCGKAPHVQYETDPTLIVEVQSPSTRSIDRREKVVAYTQATALRLVLLVDPNDRHIEAAYPELGKVHHWTVFGLASSSRPTTAFSLSTRCMTNSTRSPLRSPVRGAGTPAAGNAAPSLRDVSRRLARHLPRRWRARPGQGPQPRSDRRPHR